MRYRLARLKCETDAALRQRSSIKWSRTELGELPADIAELDFAAAAPIRRALRRSAKYSDFGYPDFERGTPLALKRAFAERMQLQHNWSPAPELMELSAQVSQALCAVILTLTRPGDVVLTHAPTYTPIAASVRGLDRQLATIPTTKGLSSTELRALLGPLEAHIGLIVLCHPHNPTGKVLDDATLSALSELAEVHDVPVFSDEIYQDLVHAPHQHQPVAVTPGLSSRTITFTSAAKSHGIPGLRCAVGHFGSARLHAAYKRLPWHLRDGASLIGITATLAAWQYGDSWLQSLRSTLRRNREVVVDEVSKWPGVKLVPPEAGYLAWLDFTCSTVADNPFALIHRHAGVRLLAGDRFGQDFGKYARLNFGTSMERLRRILNRISKVLDSNAELGSSEPLLD